MDERTTVSANPQAEQMQLQGMVALVTGAQQGIGRSCAIALARSGADVAINYWEDETKARAVADEVESFGRRAVVVRADVSRATDVSAMMSTIESRLGPAEILVNNAGIFPRAPFLELSEATWDAVLDVNLKGGFLCAQAVCRTLVRAGKRGAVINMASGAVRGVRLGVHYTASKGGVVAMTRAMALELAEHGIRVNAVAPGLTDTAQPRYEHSDDALEALARAVPLGRMAAPAEIADAVVFLASENARFITGQTLHVNGGSYMP